MCSCCHVLLSKKYYYRVTEVVFGHVSEYGFCGLHECSNSENIFMDLKLGSWLQHGTRKEDLVISLFSKNR